MFRSYDHPQGAFFFPYFSQEQCMLPEDDRMIETCRSVLSVFNVNFRLLKTIYVRLLGCY